ncbi:MAG: hypothetical protein OEZ03_05030 [Alphaproteobacteria bacterium]|nr:hypothetical protein [Alphaproteobacteria bacterium]
MSLAVNGNGNIKGWYYFLVVAAFGLFLGGCTTSMTESYTGGTANQETVKLDTKKARVVLIPLDIKLTELTVAGLEEPKAAWTEQARKHVTDGLTAALAEQGLTLRPYKKPAKSTSLRRDEQLEKLHATVGGTILFHHYGQMYRLPTKKGEMDWTLGATARQMGGEQNAEFALYVFLRDSYATGGRKAAVVVSRILGGTTQAGERVGFASLVDLRTGKIAWFNALYSDSGDVREAEPARKVVDNLLSGFPS